MARKSKPDGRHGIAPVRDDKEFISRAEKGCCIQNGNGSHFKATRPDGDTMTAYYTHGDRYPRGIGIALAKWLAAVGLVLAVACLLS